MPPATADPEGRRPGPAGDVGPVDPLGSVDPADPVGSVGPAGPVGSDDPVHDGDDVGGVDSIARTLAVVGDRWTMLVLRDVFRGLRRFDELRRELGIARPVLSDRLRKLVDAGVLEKVPYQQRPPRYEYRLTPMGRELSPALVALMRWGDRWMAGGRGPTTILCHAPCGTELEQGYWCSTCRTTFGPLAIRSRPAGEQPA